MKNNKTLIFIRKNMVWFLLLAIVALAIFFRFYQLNTLPPGLHPDEAANGLDIFKILENRDLRIIYNTNGPREALFFYFQAVFVLAMGNTITALRVAPALFGVLSVIVVFFATKEWFNRRTALITAFFFAINPWVVTIQRDGFRASLVPLFIALILLFGAKAYKTNKKIYYILAAVSLGLGFYTYTAFSMILTAIFAGFIYMLIFRRSWLMSNWKKLILSMAVFGAVMSPLLYTTIKDPGGSTARAGGTSFLNKNLNNGQPIQTLLSGTAKTILQYNYIGDSNNRHNFSGQPLLNIFVGIMFILGLVMCLFNFAKPKYALLLVVFGSMLLPSLLTAEGLPHALRSIGTAVPVLIMAGMGVNYLLYMWYQTFPINRLARITGLFLVCVLMALSLIQAYRQYFVSWAQDAKTYEAYNEGSVAIAKYLISTNNPARSNYVIMGGYEANTIEYLTHKKSQYSLLDTAQLRDLPIANTTNILIIVPAGADHDKQVAIVKAKFPNATVKDFYSDFNGKLLFSACEINQ
ncbi:MAG: glycosyltransferase family 39 protein [Patescibacteria group bacterium]|nr:glycosyltransferase family 39 protein [Patescibacteria group bacterium]